MGWASGSVCFASLLLVALFGLVNVLGSCECLGLSDLHLTPHTHSARFFQLETPKNLLLKVFGPGTNVILAETYNRRCICRFGGKRIGPTGYIVLGIGEYTMTRYRSVGVQENLWHPLYSIGPPRIVYPRGGYSKRTNPNTECVVASLCGFSSTYLASIDLSI